MMFLETPLLTRAKVLVAQGTLDSLSQADQLLADLRHQAETTHITKWLIEIMAVQAVGYNAQERTTEALDTLEQAIALGQPRGFIRTFVDLGPAMARLLYLLAERGVAPGYIGRILAAFPDISTVSPAMPKAGRTARSELVEPLTRREQEVLQLLSEWHSYHEIAETLVIAPNTVTKHASNIYQKLGVHKRGEAIAKAKTLGLLSSD